MSQSDGQNRSEAATPRRLRQARKKGQVARSRELVSAGLLLLGSLCLDSWARAFGDLFATLMRRQLTFDVALLRNPWLMVSQMGVALIDMLTVMLAPFALLALGLIALAMLPGGPVLVWDNLVPKGSRFNPLTGLGRIFSSRSWVELGKAVLKVLLIGGALLLLLHNNWDLLMGLSRQSFARAMSQGLQLIAQAWLFMGILLGVIACIDLPYQQWNLLKGLRMSKQEIKEERRSVEGRPEVKMRIRRMQVLLSRSQLSRRLPKADVVLVNPTHYAVAIRYDQNKAKAPYVVAKGVDEMALRIRELALELDKPLLPLPELTRAIYHSTRVDQEIPAALYNAVAHVLSHVMQLKAYQAGRGKKPMPLANLPIPAELLTPRGTL
jgi:flagellar biosynthetic protein FlhB